MGRSLAESAPAGRDALVGKPVLRFEDFPLLKGEGRYADDIPVRTDTLHAAILRSPHPHAEIRAIDASAARERPDVAAVIVGEDIVRHTDPFLIGFKTDMEYRALATDRVRYVGEPVAVVLATDRYRAEDALDDIGVDYEPLPAVVDPLEAATADAPVIHPKVGSNIILKRCFVHGDPDTSFAEAPNSSEITIHYPRNSMPPIECYVVVAEHRADADEYDVLSNFAGPFSLHPVMARALGVSGVRLRLRTPPDSGGAFGTKMTVFPYIVLMCVAAKIAKRPVKWVEDRLEHLAAACAAPNRVTRVQAAYDENGVVSAMRFHHWDDHGGYLRAPMPAPVYRMQGMTTGAYAMRNVDTTIEVVTTNKTPTGAVRGFGAPQLFFAIERMMHRIAVDLGEDPLEVIRRNLVPPEAFPYKSPAGALLDSGNYRRLVDFVVGKGRLDELKKRREKARSEGRLYGIGLAAVLEPGQSNMGYISTVKTAEERRRAGPKDGAIATATVSIDPLGAVSVIGDSVPQGQGHRTALAQVVADQLGLDPSEIAVNLEMDTQKDGWSIASGNYSCRFGPACASAAHLAAKKARDKLARIAGQRLNVPTQEIEFAGGRIYARDNPANAVEFYRVAGLAHWSPSSLPEGMAPGVRESVQWSASQLTPTTERGEINPMLVYGFGFDFCGVEIDRDTGEVRIDRYVSAHDNGTVINPGIADGQIRGSFAGGINAALYESFEYGEDGSFLSGTFADYLVATAHEMPEFTLLHPDEVTPSPFTPLGTKSVSEGNTTATPVCIANAVADALGVEDVTVPLTPSKVYEWIHEAERKPPADRAPRPMDGGTGRALLGEGEAFMPVPPESVWEMLFDPASLAQVIPGCHSLEPDGENRYRAVASIGVGPVRGIFRASFRFFDADPPRETMVAGEVIGPLGTGRGRGDVRLSPADGGTEVAYRYDIHVTGKVAAVGGRMLDGAARALIAQFFEALAREAGGGAAGPVWASLWRRLLRAMGMGT